jgi:hypothetical protein
MMKQTRWINILIFLSVFISSITFFKEPFEGYFHYIIFLILLPVFLLKFGMPRKITGILAILFITGIAQIFLGNNTWPLFLKIYLGVILSASFYYYVMQYYRHDVSKIFEHYLKGVVIVCYIGLFQFISHIAHFKYGYDYSWILNKWGMVDNAFGIRINSIFSEASQCAIVIAPACFVAINNLMTRNVKFGLKRYQSILILVTMVLTTSSTGYLGMFFMAILFIINYRRVAYLFIGAIVMFFGAYFLYNNVIEFRIRVDTSIGLWINDDYTLDNVNSSSFVLFNNYHIARENFSENFLTGSGLGSHPVAFDKYSLTNQADFLDLHFNKADGNSMLIRLVSETGLMGIIFFIYFIFKFFVRKNYNDPEDNSWLISGAMLTIIFLYLMRQGNYFLNGFPLFMWMYYYVYVQSRQRVPVTEETEEIIEMEGAGE